MKILITGGAGFQGSHLAMFLLGAGHSITLLNTLSESSVRNIEQFNSHVQIVWGSITDKELVEKTVREHDLIVHLAARVHVDESIADPMAYLQTNILGTYNILEAIKTQPNQPRLIYWSTCEVYGEPAKGAALSESSELKPQSPYAASKAAADRLCYAYFKTYGLKVTIVRLFNIFGERQKSGLHGALIPTLVDKAIKGETLTISGTGLQTRDYLYISDVVQAFQVVLQHPELCGNVINFASGKNTSVKAIATYVAKHFNVQIKHGPGRPGEVRRFPANIRFAKKLGFRPKVSIWQGIDHYIAWRLQH